MTMNCGYLYELRRKSEDFESEQGPAPQRVHLQSYCEEDDDDIWEVPEESFENSYQAIDDNDDEDSNGFRQNPVPSKIPSNVLQNFEIFSAQRLRLSLSAEQISLKSQQQQWENAHNTESHQQVIDKSIRTEAEVQQAKPKVVVSSNNASDCTKATTTNSSSNAALKLKNIKINNKPKDNEEKTSTTELSDVIPPLPPALKRAPGKFHTGSSALPNIKLSFNTYPISVKKCSNSTSCTQSSAEKSQAFSLGSITSQWPHIDLGPGADYCISPELMVDSVLSNASSVSVQSSSLGSGSLTNDYDDSKCQSTSNPFKMGDRTSESRSRRKSLEHNAIMEGKQSELEHPCITITEASASTSSSTINNGTTSATSTESYETAGIISRQTSIPLADGLVVHASSPDQPQYPAELLCQICGEAFKDPRCLNCLHTFCLQCIVNETVKDYECSGDWPMSAVLKYNGTDAQQNQVLHSVANARATSCSSGSTTSADSTTEGPKSDALPPTHKLRSSFSFKLRRPSDCPAKTKVNHSKICSDNTPPQPNQTQSSSSCLSRRIICKICEHSMDVPAGGIRQLPQNLVAARKIYEFQLKITDSGNSCSLCYDETMPASYYCGSCSINLCTLCKESHARQKTTVNHGITRIERQQGDQNEETEGGVKLKCNLHQGFDMKSFCITCLQMACTDCLILLHKGHKYEAIAKASQCYGRLVSDGTEQAQLMLTATEHSLNRLNGFAENIQQKCDELETEVEDYMKRYIQAVEAHKWALLQQINEFKETKLAVIRKQQMVMEKHNQETQEATFFGKELTETSTGAEVLSFVKILLKRFEYLQQFRSPIDPKLNSTPNFVPRIQAPFNKEYRDIALFGIITTQTVEPTQCTLQWNANDTVGFSQLRLHKKVELKLISRDADGLPIPHGGLKIQTHVKYKDVNSKCLRMEITDNNDGTYTIAFTPDTEGTIILMITINEKHIKGSPFSFLSRPVRPHTGIYHCCTFCSSKGNKFATCSCDGHMPGYNGCGHGHTGHPGHRHWSCCGDVVRNSECQFSNRSLNPK